MYVYIEGTKGMICSQIELKAVHVYSTQLILTCKTVVKYKIKAMNTLNK